MRIAPTAPSSVLEPFCGQARYATAFAARDISFHGVDRSEAMIALAPPEARITRSDVTQFDIGETFDLGWCPINSICHLVSEEEISGHLACMRSHVRTYVVELELVNHDGPWNDGVPDRSRWSVPQDDGTFVEAIVSRSSCDRAARTSVETAEYRRVSRQGTVLEEIATRFTMRMWTYDDWIRLTREAGFEVTRAFRNAGSRGRPEVELSAALENDGDNYYFVLI